MRTSGIIHYLFLLIQQYFMKSLFLKAIRLCAIICLLVFTHTVALAQFNNTYTLASLVDAAKGYLPVLLQKQGNVNIQYRAERIELGVPNKDGALSPGMYADVILQAKGNSEALIVPKSAVVTSTERKFVISVCKGKTVRIDVATGIENKNNVEIVGELNKGDAVIASTTDEIDEGIAVK